MKVRLVSMLLLTLWGAAAAAADDRSPLLAVLAYDAQGMPRATGSAVVVAPGVAVTNCHVVAGAQTVALRGRGEAFAARPGAADPARDLCLVKSDGISGYAVALDRASALQVGDAVWALGLPDAHKLEEHPGRVHTLLGEPEAPVLLTTAQIRPGASGGALLDGRGRLVGITTYHFGEHEVSLALPVEWVRELLARRLEAPAGWPAPEAVSQGLGYAGARPAAWRLLVRGAEAEDGDTSLANAVPGGNRGSLGSALEAHLRYREALRLEPGLALAWHNLGTSYGRLGFPGAAEDAYRQAVLIDPKLAASWNNLGVTLEGQGRLEEAEAAYREAARARASFGAAWNNLGLVLGRLGRNGEALAAHGQAVAARPDSASAWAGLAHAQLALGHHREAASAYGTALRLDPERVGDWVNLGIARGYSGQTEEAVEAYSQALARDPENALAWLNLGNALFLLGHYPQAEAAYRRTLAATPASGRAWYGLVQTFTRAGRWRDATQAMEALRRADARLASELAPALGR